jgi:hypothetical protein
MADSPRWWQVRRAQNLKPATYRCPFCGRHLPALSEHMLIVPEGDSRRRRHAHTECVMRARRRGALPTKEEWRRAQRPSGSSGMMAKIREACARLRLGRGAGRGPDEREGRRRQ